MNETTQQQKKLVSICVPCFNEVDNVIPMAAALKEQMDALPQYDYEIIFIDNYSTDGTRDKLREICAAGSKVKAILNSRNFGQFNSPYYALCQASGDCAISLSCDFQDPPELIPKMLELWEDGHGIVCPVKTQSKESGFVYFLRSCYYKLIRKLSSVDQIEHFTGFGLYSRAFLDVMRSLEDPTPFLRGIVAELGPADRALLPYEQQERKSGKTHNNFWSLYDAAMLSFTSYTKAPLRAAVFIGFAASAISLIVAVVFLVLKLTNWSAWPAGSIPVLLAVLVLGSLQLFFIGLLGEYVLTINARSMRRPLVVEDQRIGEWGQRGPGHAAKQ
ncbi:glycosyltransferase [Olsenella uli]|uniref:glycosyltransferase family 2 protein n=1 Tax=Olsenella uli TaxID=133926 RepID=UPI001958CE79|nr:glycosyltransferase family 2 protein [Olsenella uli]MBM6676084.1 glycosyltransferase [Olsenella uli]